MPVASVIKWCFLLPARPRSIGDGRSMPLDLLFLADVGGSVWLDEYDETGGESAMRTPPPA